MCPWSKGQITSIIELEHVVQITGVAIYDQVAYILIFAFGDNQMNGHSFPDNVS